MKYGQLETNCFLAFLQKESNHMLLSAQKHWFIYLLYIRWEFCFRVKIDISVRLSDPNFTVVEKL